MIPFMDLHAQFETVQGEIDAAIREIMTKKNFIHGEWAARFAKSFLSVHGGTYGVGCANGTSAITVALRAVGVKAGDEVLLPNHTFIGTAEPVAELGAIPVLVEMAEGGSYGMDLSDLEKKITPKTRAIIPVHLYGNPEPMDKIMALARKHGLKVIEDCAQAHLAKWNGRPVGTFGDLATFSFYPGKNLGAAGDAGFILTENKEHFDFVSRYIDHGRTEKYVHEFMGGNFRMDALQAAVLNVKTSRIAEWTAERRRKAAYYDERLAGRFEVIRPLSGAEAVYHLYVVQVSNRDEVMKHFSSRGIGCGIHYPLTLNAQPAFRQYGYQRGQFPRSERASERILSLAFYPEMTRAQQERVVEEFLKVAKA
jgi:dTDP-4-amino-4,6-dideoxygalactose transaminase